MNEMQKWVPRSKWQRYFLAVVLPSLCVCTYLGLIATDGFVSRTEVMVEEDSSPAIAGAELALGLLSVGGGRSKQDALLVERFITSRTMLELLDEQWKLREHFSHTDVDWIGRLSEDASAEEFLHYYRNHLSVSVDEDSLVLSIEFVAHTPLFAQQVTKALVAQSESFVNNIGQQLATQQLAFAEQQVSSAHQRLKKTSRELVQLQRKSEIFSPKLESEAVGQILAGLELELANQQTQLKALTAYLNPTAPDVIASSQRISALQQQIAQERGRLVGAKSAGLNELMLTYQDAEVGVLLATELYKSALGSLETIRVDAARKVKYLVAVDKPSLPDSAEQPRVAYWTLTIFILLNLTYFVGSLLVATIQDHRE